ncbi:hypothetical protein HGO38_01355 [Rhizobium sp. CG5]|uniref:hypothetical protein n=1 Tax=Rhizobium sp. CG5 TaxID=2726076 RepID=UPI002034289C|nr:hypothetical protein [Rhizobium sp. CG5]MCM2472122.1 hypothetical protein [Rhizobium sp. CG5]
MTTAPDEKPLLPFRVHFEDGTKLDVQAVDAKTAATEAGQRHPGIIRKTKLIRETEQG